jgi:hypothetical protein
MHYHCNYIFLLNACRLKSLQKVTSNIEHLAQQDDVSNEKYLGGRGTSRDSNSNITQVNITHPNELYRGDLSFFFLSP